jgi:hypothetical protein
MNDEDVGPPFENISFWVTSLCCFHFYKICMFWLTLSRFDFPYYNYLSY